MKYVRQMFGCGIDRQVFEAKLEGLSEEDRLRLDRVAWRMQLTFKLRYETSLNRNPCAWKYEDFNLRAVELPAIEVYLLCTCLDALTDRPPYVDFGQWLKQQEDVIGLGKQEIINLYTRYKREHGVGKNFRDLFSKLPKAMKSWLTENIIIERTNAPLTIPDQDESKLVRKLCAFFYEYWRNPFTHSSISRETVIADDIGAPSKEYEGWWVWPAGCTHFVLDRRRPNQKWSLSYRTGLDLATILRLITYARAIQILTIDLTRELISTNLENLSRLNALYAFMTEVKINSSFLKALSDLQEDWSNPLRSDLLYVGVPLFRSEASTTMIEKFKTEFPLEAGLREMTIQYLAKVNDLNSMIKKFNTANPPPQNSADCPPERQQTISEFLGKMAKTPAYQDMLKGFPPIATMMNLWLVIRDPCYT
jgi:hypothetical protein